ncbi:hypothetical protein BH11PAT1_BH11PAT1_3150 [soil metagenome]
MRYDTARHVKLSSFNNPLLTKITSYILRANPFSGFTLIELLIVISIIGILTTLSIAAYSNFNNTQKFNNTANNFINMLQVAKSRASSQYIPSQYCGAATTLDNYTVKVNNPISFELYINCGSVDVLVKTEPILGANLNSTVPSYTFYVLKDPPATAGTVTITGAGRTKTVKIDNITGRITVTES